MNEKKNMCINKIHLGCILVTFLIELSEINVQKCISTQGIITSLVLYVSHYHNDLLMSSCGYINVLTNNYLFMFCVIG